MRFLETYFTEEEKTLIADVISAAENKTSGEIRVFFERTTHGKSPEERALKVFYKLNMERTQLQNGVLFYIAFNDQKYAVIGDKGIHKKVRDDFWNAISIEMKQHFSKGELVEGLCAGITAVGQRLKKYFPVQEDDINELSDEIVFGDEKATDEEE